MRDGRLGLIVVLLLTGLMSVAQPSQRAVDSTANLVRAYYNAHRADSIYALTNASFQKAISETQFRQFITDSFASLGSWQSMGTPQVTGSNYYYPALFTNRTLNFVLALDDQQKIAGIALQPVQAVSKRQPALTNNALRSSLDRVVDSVVTAFMRKPEAVGISLGVFRNDSLFMYGYGETRIGGKNVPSSSTLFEIGSVSKTFTAILLADAVRRGQVNLDDPVSKYLPDSLPPLRHEGIDVTLRMLANHTAGLPRLPTNLEASSGFDGGNPYAQYGIKELFAYLKAPRFSNTPGRVYDYSNLGMGLLGTVLSLRTGKTYEQLLTEVLTKPLQLTSTFVRIPASEQQRMAQGYDEGGTPTSNWDFQALAGAGGIRSTVSDLLRYLQANLGKAPDSLLADCLLTQQPTHTEQAAHLMIGLGWHINPKTGWRWHNGGTGGFRSFVGFNPAKKTGIVVLANAQADSPDEVASQLIKAAGL